VSDHTPTWVAYKECGCVACLIAMTPETSASYAKEVKLAAQRGLRTEFLPVETVRRMHWRCAEHRREKQFGLWESA
jgi:hypothetical protein